MARIFVGSWHYFAYNPGIMPHIALHVRKAFRFSWHLYDVCFIETRKLSAVSPHKVTFTCVLKTPFSLHENRISLQSIQHRSQPPKDNVHFAVYNPQLFVQVSRLLLTDTDGNIHTTQGRQPQSWTVSALVSSQNCTIGSIEHMFGS